jgi:Ca2+-binding RTX toxin-like protein
MSLSWILQIFGKKSRPVSRSGRGRPGPRRFAPALEPLGDRIVPAVTAVFAPGAGVLSVFGDQLDNNIVVGRDAAGAILVNGGAVPVRGGTPTVANVSLIQVFGKAGNDAIALDEANGALPRAHLFGASGSDTLTGGGGADQLFGQSGNDTLLGRRGNDSLFGGAGNDVLTAGPGDDRVFGQSGDDRMVWNPGDGSALNEGGAGVDTVEVVGGNASEAFLATVVDDSILFQRVDPAPFSLVIRNSESLVVNMNGGDDTFAADGNIAGLVVDGGAGDDTIFGGAGNDVLRGGDGNDFVDGNQGADKAFLGAGDDVFRWDAGDGSDTVEGQDGRDAMIFNGSNGGETVDISADGERVRFFRTPGDVTMDLNDVERVDFNALGGADTVTVNDLSGTDLVEVNIDLQAGAGGGDGAADAVVVNGTAGDDEVVVAGDAGGISVIGLAAEVHITGPEPADGLTIKTAAGEDVVDASGLAAGAIRFTADGGDADDQLIGSAGDDTLVGGAGDDVLIGGLGYDDLNGAPGDDILVQ